MGKPVKIPLLDLKERTSTFKEVELCLSEEDAKAEASRCLNCPVPNCVKGCLAGVPIPNFVKKISEGDYESALKLIEDKNYFPRVCGRVCKHEFQCEGNCTLAATDGAIQIGALERFVSDTVAVRAAEKNGKNGNGNGKNGNGKDSNGKAMKDSGENPEEKIKSAIDQVKSKKPRKVAILGSGPSGLTAALILANEGHQVKIFETTTTFGGVIKYGVPEFRLPKKVVEEEIKRLLAVGVKFEINPEMVNKSLHDISKEFDAIFIGTGLGEARELNIPGKELKGVIPALDFLIEFNKDRNHEIISRNERVIVIGGGYVGQDTARTIARMGGDVTIVTLESINELPVTKKDIEEARDEDVKFLFVLKAAEFIGDKEGKLESIKFERKDGTEVIMKADKAIVAIGQMPRKNMYHNEIATKEDGLIHVNDRLQTSILNVFAAGDCVTGPKTVIEAIVSGKIAAYSIIEYLETIEDNTGLDEIGEIVDGKDGKNEFSNFKVL
jgi:glutamate synthase (NADPH/NADH) small chain